MGGARETLLFLLALGVGAFHALKPGDAKESCDARLDRMELELSMLKNRLASLEASGMPSKDVMKEGEPKASIEDVEMKSIQDDQVEKNTKDIVTLNGKVAILQSVDNGHQEQLDQQGAHLSQQGAHLSQHDEQLMSIQESIAFIDNTRPPIGAIIAWTPRDQEALGSGWQRCDGSLIEDGPLAGTRTPYLNGEKRFLRGGSDEEAETVEEDAVQDHTHADPGHSHTDNGHTHSDNGHTHNGPRSGDYYVYYAYEQPSDGCSEQDCGDGNWATRHVDEYSGSGKASIQKSYADIQVSKAGLEGVQDARVDGETRPKNMKVVYIMRIF